MPYRPKQHRPPQVWSPRQRRPSASQMGYGVHWRRLREYILNCRPLCEDPFGHHAEDNRIEAATCVDHIVPRSEGGGDGEGNLQSLCKTCHSRKTARYDGGFGRAKRQMSCARPSGSVADDR